MHQVKYAYKQTRLQIRALLYNFKSNGNNVSHQQFWNYGIINV